MITLIGSICGKRIRVVKLGTPPDYFDSTVICPHCGEETEYGKTAMIKGVVYCPKCAVSCIKEVMYDREHNYERYKTYDYQRYGVERNGGK